MTLREKRSIVHLVVMLTYFAVTVALFAQRQPAGITDATMDYRFLAIAALLLIPVQIAVAIFTHIAFAIANPEATKKDLPTFEDERDKLFELKSLRNAYQTFLAGFLLAMLALVLSNSLPMTFIVLVLTYFGAQLAWYVSQFFFYRRGY